MSSFMKIHTGNLPLSCSRGQATVSFGKDLAPRLWVRGGGTDDALLSRSAKSASVAVRAPGLRADIGDLDDPPERQNLRVVFSTANDFNIGGWRV